MGSKFVDFYSVSRGSPPGDDLEDEVYHDIGGGTLWAIVQVMQRERPDDRDWFGYLEAALDIDYLYVGGDLPKVSSPHDTGPAFLRAIEWLEENGPPDWYPENDFEMFCEELALLKETYNRIRG